jgi:integrase
VPLTQDLAELCVRLCKEHPTGPLFRRANGEPWTAQAIADRFRNYGKRFRKMGVPIPETYFAYCYRHEVATALIAGGETDAMTAGVLGHQGTKTLHKHYNHVLAKAPSLVNALRRQMRALPGETAALHEGVANLEQPAEE